MEASEIKDKHGNPIHEGDYVFTRIRGGSHEGEVGKNPGVWSTYIRR